MKGSPIVAMTDAARLLYSPLGQPGSGRVRYGAAMALFQADALSESVLEVYRICSVLDHQDPAPILAERGLNAPLRPAADPEDDLRWCLSEAQGYLANLSGEGVAEIRARLAQWMDSPVTPLVPRPNAVVDTHLPPALSQLAPTHPALAAAIAAAAPHLPWITYDLYPPEEIGPDFGRAHAYVSLVGEDATIEAEGFDFGLFLIAPHVLYRDHRHPAAELYAPLTGPHGWRFGPDQPVSTRPAHVPVWNPSMQPHMTKVGAVPFLCFFGWTGDVTAPAEVLPATDWPALEALRLG